MIMTCYVPTRRRFLAPLSAILFCWPMASGALCAQESRIRVQQGSSVVEVETVAPNIVRVHFQPNGQTTPRTLVMDPSFQPVGASAVHLEKKGAVDTLTSPEMKVTVTCPAR